MKIGILSDTHKKYKKAKIIIEFLLTDGAEFFIHAGDIVEKEILDLLAATGKRYIAVYDNNDSHLVSYHNQYNLVQEPYYFKLADTNIKLMHLPFYMTPDTEVVIFGHTHQFKSEFINGTLFLNPGEACGRNKPLSECVMLEITNTSFDVDYYARKKKTDFFEKEHFSYTRIKNG
jgi:putative phosphoesterase